MNIQRIYHPRGNYVTYPDCERYDLCFMDVRDQDWIGARGNEFGTFDPACDNSARLGRTRAMPSPRLPGEIIVIHDECDDLIPTEVLEAAARLLEPLQTRWVGVGIIERIEPHLE